MPHYRQGTLVEECKHIPAKTVGESWLYMSSAAQMPSAEKMWLPRRVFLFFYSCIQLAGFA